MSPEVHIDTNPEVLRWARESMALSKTQAAERLGWHTGALEKLENGTVKISLSELKEMSKTYKRTVATLLLQAPPLEKGLPRDFRSVDSKEIGHFHEKTIVAVRKARALSKSLIELKQEVGVASTRFTWHATLNDTPETIAEQCRALWQLEEIRQIDDTKLALETCIEKLEEAGIAVFQLSLTQDGVRGFSLVDETVPIIAVKRGETSSGKIFTLFHELGHIILNIGGICDISFNSRIDQVEKWCNAFAAEILMPARMVLQHPLVEEYHASGILTWPKKDLIALGKQFHAGPLATLRRLLTLNRTSAAYYAAKHDDWNKPPFARSKHSEGRNVSKETIAEKGKQYVTLAFKAYDQHRIDLKDLSDYLGVKTDYIQKTRQLLYA